MTITFESKDPTDSTGQNVNIGKDTTNQTTRERSPNLARVPFNSAHAMPNPETTLGDSNSREQRLERKNYRILC